MSTNIRVLSGSSNQSSSFLIETGQSFRLKEVAAEAKHGNHTPSILTKF